MSTSKRKWQDTYSLAIVPGPSSYPTLDLPSEPNPAKRQRKSNDPDSPVIERRAARFKKACPKVILERVDRVMSQRFFMIDRKREGNELREEFSVLGSTGNVYTVIIDQIPSCNCPDATKGNHCKHILFIYLKVLQVPSHAHTWYQKALLTNELETIFSQAPPAPNAIAHQSVRDAYAQVTGKAVVPESPLDAKKKRIPGPEDDCPVCYEGMHGVDTTLLTFCEKCGNGLHTECFQQWARKAADLTCVWCRARWVTPQAAGPRADYRRTSDGYLNLSNVAGISPVRDSSSYYHGPRRGGRYRSDYDYY